MAISIVITSGKGGTGKTTCCGAVGTALAMLGKRTLCIDCDIGLKNLDIVLGLSESNLWDFSDIMEDRSLLSRAVTPHPLVENLYFLSAPMSSPDGGIDEDAFRKLVESLKDDYDYILIDSPAGIGSGFHLACSEKTILRSL